MANKQEIIDQHKLSVREVYGRAGEHIQNSYGFNGIEDLERVEVQIANQIEEYEEMNEIMNNMEKAWVDDPEYKKQVESNAALEQYNPKSYISCLRYDLRLAQYAQKYYARYGRLYSHMSNSAFEEPEEELDENVELEEDEVFDEDEPEDNIAAAEYVRYVPSDFETDVDEDE